MENSPARPDRKRAPEPWGIWIGILVAVVVLLSSVLLGGLPGLAVVSVIVALVVLGVMSWAVLG